MFWSARVVTTRLISSASAAAPGSDKATATTNGFTTLRPLRLRLLALICSPFFLIATPAQAINSAPPFAEMLCAPIMAAGVGATAS